jgi:hypothetical protein
VDLLRQLLGQPPWSFGTSCHWSSSRVTLPETPRHVTSHHLRLQPRAGFVSYWSDQRPTHRGKSLMGLSRRTMRVVP